MSVDSGADPKPVLELLDAFRCSKVLFAGVALGVFVYNPAYLERPDAVPLDPFELPLREGRFETVKLSGIFGSLRDASPDAAVFILAGRKCTR